MYLYLPNPLSFNNTFTTSCAERPTVKAKTPVDAVYVKPEVCSTSLTYTRNLSALAGTGSKVIVKFC